MNEIYTKLMNCYEQVEKKISFKPELALVLGSGLGDFCDTLDIKETLEYAEIEGFPKSTVAGHKGRFVFGYCGKAPIVCMQGRVHYYEGYSVTDVVLPTRLMKLMGAKTLFLTNAAGGINPSFKAGDFMQICDHIIYNVPSPLIGANIDAVETAAHFGIGSNRAVNYNADSEGTQLLYETLSAPISAMRADAAISDDWGQSIEEDHNNRK